jgi:endonuclease III
MKGASEYAKRLKRYLASLKKQKRKPVAETEPRETDIIEEVVLAILEEDMDRNSAEAALSSIMEWMVDYNDLRVTPPRELLRVMNRYIPDAKDKALRISLVLNHVFDKKNSLHINTLRDRPIREVKQFLNLLDGMTPFVSASVIRRALGGHAIPVDEVLHRFLTDQDLAPEQVDNMELQGFLERHVLAADAPLFLNAVRSQALTHHRRVKARSERQAASGKKAGSRTKKTAGASRGKAKTAASRASQTKGRKIKARSKSG